MPIIKMNLELWRPKHRLFLGNWNAGIISKILGIIIAIILLMALSASAENMPEWNDDYVYLYGMQIYDADGEYIYDALVDINMLHEGLIIDITNGMPYEDESLLLFVLNGHIQPFYIDGVEHTYLSLNMNGNETRREKVIFKNFYLTDNSVNYLHIVSIGLLNKQPSFPEEVISGFVTSVTMPIINDVYPNATLDLKNSNYELPQMVVENHCDESCQINFFENITDEHIIFPKFIQEINSDECRFDIIATGTHNVMQMLVIVDGVPYIDDDLELECFSLDEGNGYKYTVDVKNIEEGKHQIFALAFPIYNIPEFISSSPKIVFYLVD